MYVVYLGEFSKNICLLGGLVNKVKSRSVLSMLAVPCASSVDKIKIWNRLSFVSLSTSLDPSSAGVDRESATRAAFCRSSCTWRSSSLNPESVGSGLSNSTGPIRDRNWTTQFNIPEPRFWDDEVVVCTTAGCLSRIITCTKSVSVRKGEYGCFIGCAGWARDELRWVRVKRGWGGWAVVSNRGKLPSPLV